MTGIKRSSSFPVSLYVFPRYLIQPVHVAIIQNIESNCNRYIDDPSRINSTVTPRRGMSEGLVMVTTADLYFVV